MRTQGKMELTNPSNLCPISVPAEVIQRVPPMSRSHFLRAGSGSVQHRPHALDGLEVRLRDAANVPGREEGLALIHMGFKMKGGDNENEVDEGFEDLEVDGHVGDAEPEMYGPLTSNVVRRDEGEESDADDAGQKYIIYVRIPGWPVSRPNQTSNGDSRTSLPFEGPPDRSVSRSHVVHSRHPQHRY